MHIYFAAYNENVKEIYYQSFYSSYHVMRNSQAKKEGKVPSIYE